MLLIYVSSFELRLINLAYFFVDTRYFDKMCLHSSLRSMCFNIIVYHSKIILPLIYCLCQVFTLPVWLLIYQLESVSEKEMVCDLCLSVLCLIFQGELVSLKRNGVSFKFNVFYVNLLQNEYL